MHPSFNSRTLGRVRRLTLRETIIWVKFQFTHPGKGATYLVRYLTTFPWFQFTHPGKGATSPRSPRSPWTPCFNSRTLGRVRPKRARHRGQAACFNSRTLGRVRLGRYSKLSDDRMFQFTHPGKGATRPLRTLSGVLYVSIHAPWEGCDREWLKFGVATICFNSRTLGRVRRERAIRSILTCKFQFTHPGKGATRVDCL